MSRVFTNRNWVDLDRRMAFWRFWKRVGLVLGGALAWIAISIVFTEMQP